MGKKKKLDLPDPSEFDIDKAGKKYEEKVKNDPRLRRKTNAERKLEDWKTAVREREFLKTFIGPTEDRI